MPLHQAATRLYGEYASSSASRKSVSVPVLDFNRAMYAKLSVVLKRASDDEVVASEMAYALASEKASFGLNMSSEEERLKRAFDGVTTNAIYRIAPTSESITLKESKILFIQKYVGYDRDTKSGTVDFGTNEQIRVVFVLPPGLALNDFITEIKAEGRHDAAEQHFIAYPGASVVLDYRAKDLVTMAQGARKLLVRIYMTTRRQRSKKFASKDKTGSRCGLPDPHRVDSKRETFAG